MNTRRTQRSAVSRTSPAPSHPFSGSGLLLVTALFLMSSCTSPKPPAPEPVPQPPNAPEVVEAEKLFEAGHMQDAIMACIDISKKNPEAIGLSDLRYRITEKLAEERAEEAKKRTAHAAALDTADAKRFGATPDTYRKAQHVVGDYSSLRATPTPMQQVLATPVTVQLVNAGINEFIEQLGQSKNINIIADSEISDKKFSIHAEKTPLIEILEYIGRNLNVTFSVGNNLIWVTPKEEQTSGVPMETRIYRLRKGLVGSELGRTAKGVSLFRTYEQREGGDAGGNKSAGDSNSSSSAADVAGKANLIESVDRNNPDDGTKYSMKPRLSVGLLDAIARFVPQAEGTDYVYNDKVHALIVKNTRENLALVEDLITAMDVRPVQVLIEARFVTTTVTDLRQLGIEWLLDSKGTPSITGFDNHGFAGALTGVNENNVGGANLTYQFLLGNTQLKAVLRALEKAGNSRTVVVPRVTTLNNREARFRVGQDTSYFEEVDTNIMTSGGYGDSESRDNVTYDYNRPTIVETGYSLIVTPSVGADLSTINLVLRPEISSIDEWKKYRLSSLDSTTDPDQEPAIEIPVLARQYIETEAVVRSGETVVLGGLADTSKTDDSSGTPWLSKLPWLGNFFKVQENSKSVKNILIFVTATLISDAGEELIPINDHERYGLAVSPDAKVPDILKAAPAAQPVENPTPAPVPAPAPAAQPPPAATAPAQPAAAPAAQ